MADTAKVFMSGRSQAVRLPKAYRFDCDEVEISREGDAVILRPVHGDPWANLKAVLKAINEERFDELFPTGDIERPQEYPDDRNLDEIFPR